MSRVQLAELVDVNPQTIGALERGDHSPSLDLAFRICAVFQLPVEAVFSRTEFTSMAQQIYRLPSASHHSPTPAQAHAADQPSTTYPPPSTAPSAAETPTTWTGKEPQ